MEVRPSPVNVIEETNFPNAWARAVGFVVQNGVIINFGGPDKNDKTKIERKTAKDSRQLIVLTGSAIAQIENMEVHPQFNMKGPGLKEYCSQLTYDGVTKWVALPDGDQHKAAYNYFELMSRYPRISTTERIDQIKILRENLAEQIAGNFVSNRTQAITWQPEKHAKDHEPPCLQRIQVRYLGEDDGGHVADLDYNWRSRDLYDAWPANVVCVTAAINREVLRPNNCRLIRISDYSASLHIYKYRWDEAAKVKLLPVNPQQYRG